MQIPDTNIAAALFRQIFETTGDGILVTGDEGTIALPDTTLCTMAMAMTVPGATCYRESCLAGDYQLYVGLYYSSERPPLPQDGDYI